MTPATTFQRQLFVDAIALLREIPESRFDLSVIRSENKCGTLACAMGWLANTPKFQEAGISLVRVYDGRCHDLRWGDDDSDYAEAAEKLFGVTYWEGERLFCSRGRHDIGEVLEHPELTDRQIWLKRAEKFLAEKDQQLGYVEPAARTRLPTDSLIVA